MSILITEHKVKNNVYPLYLCKKFILVGDVQSYNSRNNYNFRLWKFRTFIAINMLMRRGLKLYNDVPREIRQIGS